MDPEHSLRRVGRLVPESLIELEAGAECEQVELGQLDSPLLAEVEPVLDVAGSFPIAAAGKAPAGEDRERTGDVSVEAGPPRSFERLVGLENHQRVHGGRLRAPPIPPPPPARRPHRRPPAPT